MITNRQALARLAASTALAATLIAGYATALVAKPTNYASKAETALAKGQTGKAVALAEQAVRANPRDGATRALLGAAYLKAGRFASATEAYDAALELGDESVPTVLGLALAETAQGNSAAALELLNDWRDVVPASDLGLAYALAGNAPRGVAVLTEALRSGDTTVKLRQNLAFAYALGGKWREARVMLAQDVPADKINDRIGLWAQLAVPGADRSRVAHLLDVPVVGDSGQPAELALANFPSAEALALIAAPPAAPEAYAPEAAAPVEVAAAEAAPVEVAAVEQAVVWAAAIEPTPMARESDAPAPIRFASLEQPSMNIANDSPAFISTPVVQAFATLPAPIRSAESSPAPVTPAQVRPASSKPPRIVGKFVPHGADAARPGKGHTLTAPKPVRAVIGGSHWVQLGSYENPTIAKDGWRKFIARTPALKPYKVTTTTATVRGTPVWRVAATGFASYSDAFNMCRTVKGRGGACLVVTAPRGLGGSGGATARR